jgi:hypothetical protein
MKKKAATMYRITLDIKEKELKGLVESRVNLWTDWLLPAGILLGLVVLFFCGSALSKESPAYQSLLAALACLFPMILGTVISTSFRSKVVKAKLAELKELGKCVNSSAEPQKS